MIEIPPNFPSYTSYSPKVLIQHVDQLKAAIRELQEKISKLEAQAPAAPATKKKEAMNG
jgi:phage shock protein A